MKETSLIIAQQPWVNALHFYQVKLRPGGDTPRFLHQLTLTRLALFAADALRQLQRQDKAPKPLLIAAPDVEKNKTLVVAVLGSARYWRGPGGLHGPKKNEKEEMGLITYSSNEFTGGAYD